eukprot:gene9396-10379_t
MSQLLLHWLNEEVKISEPVYQFDEAFRNGYLLGEILFRFNQQLDFQEFSTDPKSQSVLHNFELLEPTMRKIGVVFNSRIAKDILRGDEKVTKGLLYEMKVALENLRRNCGHAIPSALRGTRSDKVLSMISTTKPAYEKSQARTFQIAVRNALDNPNQVMMERATKKYTDRAEDYYRTISMGESLDQATLTVNRTRARDVYKSRKAHEGEFAEAWESINLDQWKRNQKTAHDRRMLKKRVVEELERRRTSHQELEGEKAKQQTWRDMGAFDEHLRHLIISEEEESKSGSPKFIRTIQLPPKNESKKRTISSAGSAVLHS